MSTTRALLRWTTIASMLLAGAAAPTLTGCGKGDHETTEAADADALVADYTVRGRVAQIPASGAPTSSFRVHHEPIPEWKKNYNEAPVGMRAMIMEFPPSSDSVIEGLAVGDAVLLTFRVEYDEEGMLKGWKATRVEQLPDDTVLEFEREEGDEAPATEG